jgi:hypothetical protein
MSCSYIKSDIDDWDLNPVEGLWDWNPVEDCLRLLDGFYCIIYWKVLATIHFSIHMLISSIDGIFNGCWWSERSYITR